METSVNLLTIQPFRSAQCVRLSFNMLSSQSLVDVLGPVVDRMGILSARAQGLGHTLTSYDKLLKAPEQILYIFWTEADNGSGSLIIGFLKCVRRVLYLHDTKSQILVKRNPICLLDFYVCEGLQRKGNGKVLYDAMLKDENVLPEMVAIDKPSESLLRFLLKHYKLSAPFWQSNNYVIYPGFFDHSDFLETQAFNGNSSLVDRSLFTLHLNSLALDSKDDMQTAKNLTQPQFRSPAASPSSHSMVECVQRADCKSLNGSLAALSTTTDLHLDHPDSFFAMEKSMPHEIAAHVESIASSPIGNLAKERKLLSMGHHKLW